MHRLCHILLFLLPMVSVGQNLVPNPSFEEYTWCSTFNQESGWALDWFVPGFGQTPDYYNSCSEVSGASVPDNSFGFQDARSGDGYIGFYAYAEDVENIRDFITVELTQPLSANKQYVFSAYFSLADDIVYSVSLLGGVLTEAVPENSQTVLSNSLTMTNNPSFNLNDKSDWMLVTDTITAIGNENFLTIGCVAVDSMAGITSVGNGVANWTIAYYYVDDVSLISLDTLLSIEKSDFTFSVYPNPATTNLTIESRTPLGQVWLRDVAGRVVLPTLRLRSGYSNIDVSGLPSGIYLIEVLTQNGQRSVQKVVVE